MKEGAFTPEQLARRAAELGMSAVAMTDRDGLYGAARFVRACEQEGVRPLLGASLTVRASQPGPRPRRSMPTVVLLATDDAGYANLCRLITDAHMLGERGDPGSPRADLRARRRARWRWLGPRSHPGRLAVARPHRRGARARSPRSVRPSAATAASWASSTGWSRAPTSEVRAMLRLAERADVRAVATNPVRYLVPQDAFLADALECMRRIVPVAATTSRARTRRAG